MKSKVAKSRRSPARSCSEYFELRDQNEDCPECLGQGWVWDNDNGNEEDTRITCTECRGSCKKNSPVFLTVERLKQAIDAGKGAVEWWMKAENLTERESAILEHIWMAMSPPTKCQDAMNRGHIIPNTTMSYTAPKEKP